MYKSIPTIEEFEKAVVDQRISASEHDNYILFKYRKDAVYARDWDEITLHARGIIFDMLTRKCVVLPFKKFFNLDETADEKSAFRNDLNYEILEKMDGSMGNVFLTRDNELHVATPGSLMSDQAQWATKWLRNHKSYKKLRDKFISGELRSIVAEIICPISRVVVKYDFDGMVLIAAHDLEGNYMDYQRLTDLSEEIGFKVCRKFTFDTVDDVKEFLKSVEEFEGFVVHWPDVGYRVKMKGDDYCMKHRILSSIHPNRIDEAIQAAGHTAEKIWKKIEESLKDFPEEFVEPYRDAFNALRDEYNTLNDRVNTIVTEHENDLTKEFVFYLRDEGEKDEFYKIYFSHIMNTFNGRVKVKNLIKILWKRIRDEHFKDVEDM